MEVLVNIDVDDLDRALAFYQAAFGLTIGRRFGDDTVELVGASSMVYLLVKAPDTKPFGSANGRRHYGRHWTPVHLDFVVDDCDEAVRRAVAAGARLESPIRNSNWGKLAMLADPFGHGFCFIQFVGRGYDEIARSP